MRYALNDDMTTIGIFMAVVCDHSSENGTTGSHHDVPLALCLTADGENNTFIMTQEIYELFDTGYYPIAVLRFDPNVPGVFPIFTAGELPECLKSALSRKSVGLIQNAMSWLARGVTDAHDVFAGTRHD
jgi:hypothetical protein